MTSNSTALTFDEQLGLLHRCVKQGVPLKDELSRRGVSYDDLRYRIDGLPQTVLPGLNFDTSFLSPLSTNVRTNGIPVLSFFTGAGGLDLGFEAAGFAHLAAIEINQLFCDTLRRNRPHWKVLGPPIHSGDIRNRDDYSHLLRQGLGLTAPFEGVFIGGPPCQSFSIAANQRFNKSGPDFKRTGFNHTDYGNLLFDYIWYITEFKPRAFLIENVPGLLSVDEGVQVRNAVAALTAAGYQVLSPSVLNAADYGVPQHRHRAFILGSRQGECPTLPRAIAPPVPCGMVLARPLTNVTCHVTREHKAESILRYMEMRYGQREPLGRVDRLHPGEPSKTVIAGGAGGGGRSHLHPTIPRTLSVRESARLQTFPDDYIFCGPSARQFTQVGNAVPPVLARRLADSLYLAAYECRS